MDDRRMRRTRPWFFLLAVSAGFTNLEAAVGSSLAVSHHTGCLTQFALALEGGRWQLMATYLALVLFFFLGSLIAGVIFFNREIGKSKGYGLFSLAQGLVTVLATFLLADSWRLALYFFAALSLGAQNGILAFVFGGLLALLARSGLADKTMAVAGGLQILIGLYYLSQMRKTDKGRHSYYNREQVSDRIQF